MKTSENQNVEFKASWRDEYIKWICGFANANGGKMYIGVKDDGTVLGVDDAKKLAEEIPNKTRDLLGIIVDVNIKTKTRKTYLEIIVESYPFPISYKGQYHYRTGATKQELKGAALDRFILRKQGKQWDSFPVPKIYLSHLETKEIDNFKKVATNVLRLNAKVLQESNKIVLQNLKLYEEKYFNRAAVLLFHPQPHTIITGAYIKIGFFKNDHDLVFQNEIFGPLFQQVNTAMDMLQTKYLTAKISYQGIHRVERLPYPELALREAILNAVAHKDYSKGNPIQISVYANKIMIYNDGELPETWTVEKLLLKHPSAPYNSLISRVFFLYGLIEAWGRGISIMIKECTEYGVPAPILNTDFNGFFITFYVTNSVTNSVTNHVTNHVTNDVTNRVTNDVTNDVTNALNMLLSLLQNNSNISVEELAMHLNKNRRTVLRYLDLLKETKVIKRIGNNRSGYWKIKNN